MILRVIASWAGLVILRVSLVTYHVGGVEISDIGYSIDFGPNSTD